MEAADVPIEPVGERPLSGDSMADEESSLFSNIARRFRTPDMLNRFTKECRVDTLGLSNARGLHGLHSMTDGP